MKFQYAKDPNARTPFFKLTSLEDKYLLEVDYIYGNYLLTRSSNTIYIINFLEDKIEQQINMRDFSTGTSINNMSISNDKKHLAVSMDNIRSISDTTEIVIFELQDYDIQ